MAQVVPYGADTALPTANIRSYRDILVCIPSLRVERGESRKLERAWPLGELEAVET